MSIFLVRIAAVFCCLAVVMGAFGAHALRATLESHGMTDVWNKAVLYQFMHGMALLVFTALGVMSRVPAWLFIAGIVIFSGSLYLLALTNLRWLGAITPIGGLCFIAGWVWLIFTPIVRQ